MLSVAENTRITVVDDPRQFAELRPEWDALLRDSAANCPFLTWEWLNSWWTHLHGASRLRLITVRDGRELVAIAPFRLSRGTVPVFSQLEFLGTGHAGSDYLDIIARRGREPEALEAIAGFLKSERLALHLMNVSTSSLAAQLPARLAPEGWSAWESQHAVCPVIGLAGHTWDSYLGTLGSSHRANVRRRIRALDGQFRVRFEAVTTEAARQTALDTLITYHDERWGGRGSAFLNEPLRAFHHEVTRRAMDQGWLRLYALHLNDALAAVMYGFLYDGRFWFFQHGFDAQYQPNSLGLVLMGLSIKAAIDEGATEFDMLYGNEPYKSLWASDRRPLAQLRLFPSHIGGTIHRHTVEAERTMRAFVRRMLPNGGVRAA